MLDDDDRRIVLGGAEQGGELPRRVRVEHVVPGEFPALELAETAQNAAAAHLPVNRRALVRVLPVARRQHLLEFQLDGLRQRPGLIGGRRRSAAFQPFGDRGVVVPGVPERLERQFAPELLRQAALGPERFEDPRVVRRVDHDRHVGEVLRRGPDHAWAADIDHLHRAVLRRIRGRSRGGEGVEIHGHQIDRRKLVPLELRSMFRPSPVGEDAAEDAGMQALDPPMEDLGVPRHIGHRRDGYAMFPELPRRAARRDDLDTQIGQSRTEFLKARLVEDRDQCAANGEHRSRRSVARQGGTETRRPRTFH